MRMPEHVIHAVKFQLLRSASNVVNLPKFFLMDHRFSVAERFMRYVQVDTQSDPHSNSIPSTEKQKDLSRILVAELQEMGIADAHLDEWGYVYATIPATSSKNIPGHLFLCACGHLLRQQRNRSQAHRSPKLER